MKDYVFEAERSGKLLEMVRDKLSDMPSGKVKSYLEHGCISIDGKVSTKFDCQVTAGQMVRVTEHGTGKARDVIDIIYEDDYLVAVNKPSGLLTVASDTEKERTAFRMLKPGREGMLFPVHRLDRDTSGVLLFAKSYSIRDRIQKSWSETPKREYIAICDGVFKNKEGRIETYLRETSTHFVYSSEGTGKKAITNYEVIQTNGVSSMVRVRLETGRKNQIRVHLAELGHAVLGDKKYGSKNAPRLMLHASTLAIIHPVSGKRIDITAPLPVDFKLAK